MTFGFLVLAGLLFLATVWIADGFVQALINLPFPAAVLVWGWWTWVWPIVEVSDRGLVLRNQLRTILVPWEAVTGIESRFGVYVTTSDKRYLAAGVPARGGLTQSRETKETPPALTFPKSIQQTIMVGPGVAVRMLEEEKLYHDHPGRRPELSATGQQNLRRWAGEGQTPDSRFSARFAPGSSIAVTWNWLPIALQAATLAAIATCLLVLY